MTHIRAASSLESTPINANKKPKLTSHELSELADMLSDSDDWDGNIQPNVHSPLANRVRQVVPSSFVIPQPEGKKPGWTGEKISDSVIELLDSDSSTTSLNVVVENAPTFSNDVKVEDMLEASLRESRPHFEQSSFNYGSIPDKISIPTNKGSPLNNNISSNEVNNSALSDERSIEILQEQSKLTFGNKFTLLTQAPTFTNSDDIDERPKLPPNVKVKIPIRLSREQEHIIDLAEKGYNIFYTGSAGTGKSVLLKEMIKRLKSKYGAEEVAVTASTGLAACNIGGFTIHSFSGVGLAKGDADRLYKKVRRSRKHLKRWENISALVVDEISMIDAELLDKLDYIAQRIRKNHSPFGGIQLILCGDFFQLPPVSKDPENPTKFAFESKAWKTGIQLTIMLQRVFRQQGDTKFIEMLNKMRLGQIDEDTEREFKKLSRPLPNDEIIPAELYSTRNEVDRANSARLTRLPGKVHTFNAIDGGSLEDQELKEKLLQNFLAPKQLHLKVGAQVMMIKNIDAKLVNGSLGKVIDFIDADTYMFYNNLISNPRHPVKDLERMVHNPSYLHELKEMMTDEEEANQKRQKLVKDKFCQTEPENSMEPLGSSIFEFLDKELGSDPEVKQNLARKKALLRQLHNNSSGRRLPLVRFKTSDLATRTVLVEPEDWAIEDEHEKPIVSRIQLPLMLAWSLSIHKSQGQTLPKVKVDLRRIFEKGQAYVALSRAVSREGLQVLNFDKNRIGAHQKVIDFYMTLVSAEHALKQADIKCAETTVKPISESRFAPKTTRADRIISGNRTNRQLPLLDIKNMLLKRKDSPTNPEDTPFTQEQSL
ncbi:hypothetical protein KAFR_0I00420 [Kazachstania africana CBS 2517]|uniref:ATP-dependent DNA helicase PIF1 n=1 Tax=Kazachstania africana (strain ATCC 22294 / BCRC 22015 / CBS 2517 / CECT 1963 / NBRC 1671 / NRRL Y-8276) TaxID=1071382 RepID=H2AZM3_KAZAF|nr:hypothetical protein KAFR_0I00420 [Kazachstania africana CBS 2517]CCF59823.1 hypothetical protein KAFR_0I00420 [Kazachstania africana CBS 2517]